MLRKLKNVYHLLQAIIANVIYGFPAKRLICVGVTGTDGKSTTSNLIYHILRQSGKKVGLISTVNCLINDENYKIGFHTTTPTTFALQKLLKKMVNNNCQFGIIEVASHGIDQKRIWGIPFKIGVLTNITREHLDYHKTMKNYTQTKISFLKSCDKIILPVNFMTDDDFWGFKSLRRIHTYGINSGDVRAENVRHGQFSFRGDNLKHNLLGSFNVENILAAIAVCLTLGISENEIKNSLKDFKGIKGRLEEIVNNKNLHVFVDFAHTPNAIQQVLTTLRDEFPKSKIIHIFGATGKRDKEKRPLMGEISGKMADLCVLTSEDTYGDDPNKIITMVEEGIKKTNKIKDETYFIFPDRRRAFEEGIKLANANDVVVATGVGHQTTMNVGHEIEWSDQEEMRKILKNNL